MPPATHAMVPGGGNRGGGPIEAALNDFVRGNAENQDRDKETFDIRYDNERRQEGVGASDDHPSADLLTLDTEFGAIAIRLRPDLAPKHCELITRLVTSGSYDGCVIYRAEPHFVVQGGLRLASGGVRPNPFGKVPLEYTGDMPPRPPMFPGGLRNTRGTVTMARWADPSSGDGEWFINLKDSPHLDRTGDSGWGLGFTVFGVVESGLSVADRLSDLPTREEGGMRMLTRPVRFKATVTA